MKNAIPKLWIAELVSRMLTALATVYVARVLGVTTYGVVGFVAAVLAYLLVFVRFGTDDILVRELSRHDGFDDIEKSQLRTSAIIARAAFSVPAIALLFVLATTAEATILRNLYLASMIMLLGAIFPVDVYLQSEERFASMAGVRIVANLVNLSLVLLFVRSVETSWVVPAASGAGVLMGEVVFFRSIKGTLAIPTVHFLRRLFHFLVQQGLPLLGSMMLLLLVGQLSIILVRVFCSSEELGWYVAGYKVYDVGNALLVPTATVLFPKLSSVWPDPDTSRRTSLIVNGMSITVSIALLLLGGALLSGREIIPFLFGRSFTASSLYVSVLAVALVFRSISMLLANGLVAGGRQKTHLLVTSIFVTINIVLGVVLIRSYGAIGAAVSIVIAFACELASFLVALRNSISLSRVRALLTRIGGVWCAVFVPLYATTLYFQREGEMSLALAVGGGVVFSGIFLFFLGRLDIVTLSLIRKNLFEA
jgi:O-antigen/teichoic acid export membrane protein